MKQKKLRLFGLLLAAAMLLGCLPVQALAAEGGWFYLAADWNGTLLIAPERVSYTADQTIFEALNASGHSFGPRVDNVSKIDGKAGSFIRSDENGDHDLGRNASEANIRYLRFVDNASGSRTAQPSAAMQQFIAAMADYKLEAADVQKAARTEYDAACAKYCTASDADALELYTALQNAVKQYKDALDGTKYCGYIQGSEQRLDTRRYAPCRKPVWPCLRGYRQGRCAVAARPEVIPSRCRRRRAE